MKLCEHLITKLMMFCLLVGVVLLSGAPPVSAQNVKIPNTALRLAIKQALGPNRTRIAAPFVTEADMKTLTSLTLSHFELLGGVLVPSDLTGLEKATNLTSLELDGTFTNISALSSLTNLTSLKLDGRFTDISALSRLTNLTSLDLRGNSLSDISALSGLTNLTTLELQSNSISGISALSGLTSLTTLNLRDNSISDISALSGLTNLTTLDLVSNSLSSISALSGLTSLTTLKLGSNSLSDISALSGLTNLTTLGLLNNSISGISALSGLTSLTTLNLRDNSISDISALSGLTNLTTLDLVSNSLSSISALSGLTSLTILKLGSNSISDISALSGLTNLTTLGLRNNRISDISRLVSNTGLGTGDSVNLSVNQLSYSSIFTRIPALQARSVTVTFDNRTPHTDALRKVSGDAQNGAISTALASPFVVEVKDSANKTFEGVPVTFAVTAGGGTLSATSVATDSTGRAQTTLTLGATTGTNTVTATVIHAGRWRRRTFSVSFTANANDRHPTFTSAATFSVAENTPATTAVGTVVATDADSQDSVTGYTLSGADSATFSITNAGVLTFNASPDYDTPGDLVSTTPANAAGNNEYIIVVTVTSGSGARQATATQTLTITVTDVDEAPAQPAAPTVTAAAATPTQLSVNWTAPSNAGPAITDYDVRYRADVTSPTGDFTDAHYNGTTTSTTLTDLKPSTSYQVQVRARSDEGIGPWSDAGTAKTAVQPEDVDNDGDVDINDLLAVISNFGSASPGRNDVDSDGDVDADDIRRVFNELLTAERAAAGAPAQAARRITHTAEALHHYVQQTKQNGMLDGHLHRALRVLEELIEPFLTPDETALLRNYPNPFNPETWIPYQLSKPADVTFSIYSVDGRLVRTLSLGYQAAGVYRHRSRAAYWDGRNALGESVASGVYFYTLTAGAFIATGKMLIRK